MKLKLLMLTILLPFNLAASSILCTGLGNQGELIELSLEFSPKKAEISIDGFDYPVQVNNEFSIAWSNTVNDIDFINILSKINGSLQVLTNNNGAQELRASLMCVESKNALFN